jgi:hypothetical protein
MTFLELALASGFIRCRACLWFRDIEGARGVAGIEICSITIGIQFFKKKKVKIKTINKTYTQNVGSSQTIHKDTSTLSWECVLRMASTHTFLQPYMKRLVGIQSHKNY